MKLLTIDAEGFKAVTFFSREVLEPQELLIRETSFRMFGIPHETIPESGIIMIGLPWLFTSGFLSDVRLPNHSIPVYDQTGNAMVWTIYIYDKTMVILRHPSGSIDIRVLEDSSELRMSGEDGLLEVALKELFDYDLHKTIP